MWIHYTANLLISAAPKIFWLEEKRQEKFLPENNFADSTPVQNRRN